MTEERLTELETKLAFAEDLLETLNQTVTRQQGQIDSLQQQLRLLHQQVRDALPEDTRPPARRDPAALLTAERTRRGRNANSRRAARAYALRMD